MHDLNNTYLPMDTIYHTSSGDVIVSGQSLIENSPQYPPDWIVFSNTIINLTKVNYIYYDGHTEQIHFIFENQIDTSILDEEKKKWKKVQEILARGG